MRSNYRVHTTPYNLRRPVRLGLVVVPSLRRVAGWTMVALTALLVPVSVYAWHDAHGPSSSKAEGSGSSAAFNGHNTSSNQGAQNAVPTTSGSGNAHVQLHAAVGSSGKGDSTGSQQVVSHVSASATGNHSSSVTINGETVNVPPNQSVNRTIVSSDNASLNVTMQSSTNQTVSGSSSLNVQMESSSTTEGGQQ